MTGKKGTALWFRVVEWLMKCVVAVESWESLND